MIALSTQIETGARWVTTHRATEKSHRRRCDSMRLSPHDRPYALCLAISMHVTCVQLVVIVISISKACTRVEFQYIEPVLDNLRTQSPHRIEHRPFLMHPSFVPCRIGGHVDVILNRRNSLTYHIIMAVVAPQPMTVPDSELKNVVGIIVERYLVLTPCLNMCVFVVRFTMRQPVDRYATTSPFCFASQCCEPSFWCRHL